MIRFYNFKLEFGLVDSGKFFADIGQPFNLIQIGRDKEYIFIGYVFSGCHMNLFNHSGR